MPLKLWRPRFFSATALCAGSIAPDLEFVIRPTQAGIGHSVVGQFVFCLPLSVAISWLVARFVGPALAKHLPRVARWRLEDLGRIGNPLGSLRSLRVVVGSSLVGSFSHLGLDQFTHSGTWVTRCLPGLQGTVRLFGERVPWPLALQLGVTAIGAAAVVPVFDRVLARGVSEEGSPPSASTSLADPPGSRLATAMLVAAPVAAALAAFALSRSVIAESRLYFHLGRVYVWGYVAFRAFCAAFVALTLVTIVLEGTANLPRFGKRPLRGQR